jgi:micrococcal nuclease
VILILSGDKQPRTEHQAASPLKTGYVRVVEVVDGDTIKVRLNDKIETVRLIGIDAPENDKCFSPDATSNAQKVLLNQQVRLKADKSQNNRDVYGRLLRYVFLEDGANFNRLMITEGYAKEYTFISPYKHQSKFKKAQQEAKRAEKGLWSPGVCEDR